MKMMKRQILAQVAFLAASALVTPWTMACSADMAKPFTAGPIAQQPATGTWTGPFSEWVVDSNGVGLQICTDSVDGQGNPPPCFYDPIDPANAYTQSLTRGGEAFWFLADSVFDTTDATGAQALRAVIVMGVESAFLSDPPAPGFETQFQRLRTRIDVAKLGVYHVETPWGRKTYTVTTLLDPGNGQNRSEISEPIDITFGPGSNAGLVTPFLIADNRGGLDPTVYIGDGLTPTTVTGSPCGDNFVRVTAFAPDGVTPLDINGGSNVYTNAQFAVFGKIAPAAAVPLSIGNAYYSHKADGTIVNVMAEGSASLTALASVTVNINGVTAPMVRDGARFFARVPVTGGPLPTSVTLTATDPGRPSTPNVQTAQLRDLVTINSATASCTGTGVTRACTLTVDAVSSNEVDAPALTLLETNTPVVNGTAVASTRALPGVVTVRSALGGMASKPVTIAN